MRRLIHQAYFNHTIGLPQKNGQLFPLFGYEQMLYDILQNHKLVWIKKAAGLGITEFSFDIRPGYD
jgi:hypothetical protein